MAFVILVVFLYTACSLVSGIQDKEVNRSSRCFIRCGNNCTYVEFNDNGNGSIKPLPLRKRTQKDKSTETSDKRNGILKVR